MFLLIFHVIVLESARPPRHWIQSLMFSCHGRDFRSVRGTTAPLAVSFENIYAEGLSANHRLKKKEQTIISVFISETGVVDIIFFIQGAQHYCKVL